MQGESHVRHKFPGAVLRGVGGLARIVRLEALLHVGGQADIGLVGIFQAADEVDVFHESPRKYILVCVNIRETGESGKGLFAGDKFGCLKGLIAGGACWI